MVFRIDRRITSCRNVFTRLLSTLIFSWGAVSVASAQDHPNILLVMADDMGFSDLGAYGGEIETPNLDTLAASGMQFLDFHVSVACSPTRAMLMSGNDNHIAGLGAMGELLAPNQKGQPGYEGYLNDRVASMAEVFKSSGYHTYMTGKWHLGHSEGWYPYDRGFDQTFTMLVGAASHWDDMLGVYPDDDPAKYAQNGAPISALPADFYSSRSYADMLMDMIRSNRGDGKPFLGYLAFTAGHDPLHVPEPWLSKYAGAYDQGYETLRRTRWEKAKSLGIVPATAKLAPLPSLIRPWDTLSDKERAYEARSMETYAGMIEAMDYHYGRVVDFLDDIGELDNTIIIFLSDNGSNPWYSDNYPGAEDPEFARQFDNSYENIGHPLSNIAYGPGWAVTSASPLDRFKNTVSEGGIRVPFMMAGPGIVQGGKSDAFAYVWDVLPTLLDMTGSDYPADKEQPRGRSMLPVLSGQARAVYAEGDLIGGEVGGGQWMRQGSFKAVMIPAPYGDGVWRLFNTDIDPGEVNDLSGDMPQLLTSLMAAWEDYAEDVGVVPAE
ncbi:arylsulfatase [Shimia thalassica]|uniref:arylsulfatase n=1 Tax=Shimia thalassica TaxID=1715693 RepID=UPI0027334E78|nr:arylsulfatase [Shimia thalassica]MDP2579975.1 arylsulfatase [Shimia thalassica]